MAFQDQHERSRFVAYGCLLSFCQVLIQLVFFSLFCHQMNNYIQGKDQTEHKVISVAEQNVADGHFVRGFMVSILEQRVKVGRKDRVID